jgi:Bacterial low temperature requirement A protein (LtrA)
MFRTIEHQVTQLDLFFDLVFVFAITQVTALLTHDPTWIGLVHGALVLAAIWWAWTGYTWLTSSLDVDEGGVRLVMLAAMAVMLGVALAAPEAFAANAALLGDPPSPLKTNAPRSTPISNRPPIQKRPAKAVVEFALIGHLSFREGGERRGRHRRRRTQRYIAFLNAQSRYRAAQLIVVHTADKSCEREANISPTTRGHARVMFPLQIPSVCGAFVPPKTRPCPRLQAWFQDGKEAAPGSSPGEGLKLPLNGVLVASAERVEHHP